MTDEKMCKMFVSGAESRGWKALEAKMKGERGA